MLNHHLHPPKLIMAALLLLTALQQWYYFDLLPEKTAIHFGPSGRPDGWASPETAVSINLLITVIIAALFLGINWIVPRVPYDLINIPNRDYWLAPERRQKTLNDVLRYLLWFADLTLLFMLVVYQGVIEFNLSGRYVSIWWPLGIYLFLTGVWIWHMYRHFHVDNDLLTGVKK